MTGSATEADVLQLQYNLLADSIPGYWCDPLPPSITAAAVGAAPSTSACCSRSTGSPTRLTGRLPTVLKCATRGWPRAARRYMRPARTRRPPPSLPARLGRCGRAGAACR